jgi:hypothetical protein
MTKKIELEEKLLQFRGIEIAYATTEQYWGITVAGVKRRIGSESFNIFLKSKRVISHKDSKFIKEGIRFIIASNNIQIFLKNTVKSIKYLNN